jgi:chitodextrinase
MFTVTDFLKSINDSGRVVQVDTENPTAPTLSISEITENSVRLTWTPGTDDVGVTSYMLYVNGQIYTNVVAFTLIIDGLQPQTSYDFNVAAMDLVNNFSPLSNTITETTLGGTDVVAPSQPQNLMTSALTDTTLTLTWEASTDNVGVIHYEVYQDDVFVVNRQSLNLNIVGLTPNTKYKFHVIAKDASDNSSEPSISVNPTTVNSAFSFPPEIDVDEFDFGTWDVAGLPAVIVEGTTFVDGDNQTLANRGDRGGAVITCVADDSKRKFHTDYPRHAVFNADDTWMKFATADSWDPNYYEPNVGRWIGGEQCFVPVATAGNPATYFYTGVDGGGYWSNVDPDKLFVLINNDTGGASNLRYQTRGVAYTGFEPILHTFTANGYNNVGWGMREGIMSWGDEYMAFSCTRISDGQPMAVILDIQDCIADPNGPNNIHATLELADNGGTLIDWISVSPSGKYFIIAYFGDATLNPRTGNAIIVYDNVNLTSGEPTLMPYTKINNEGFSIQGCAILQESHSGLALDQDGNDVWVGFKTNGINEFNGYPAGTCSTENYTALGGCMEKDNSTFLVMARFSDGAVKNLYSDTNDGNPYGLYSTYISALNTKRPGWVYVSDGSRESNNAASTDMIALKLTWDDILAPDGNIMEFYGRSYARGSFNPTGIDGSGGFTSSAVPSRNGTMVAFDSYFNNTGLYSLHAPSPANEGGDMGRNQGTGFLLEWPQ